MTTSLSTERLGTAREAQRAGLSTQLEDRPSNVKGWLLAPSTGLALQELLPNGSVEEAKRWLSIIATEIRKNPKLLDADWQSFALAVRWLAQLQLEPGPLGFGYLTGPFQNNKTGKKEVVPIAGYKGLIDLAYRGGTVDLIDAVPVRDGEPFRIRRGAAWSIEHEELESCKDNAVIAYYAIAFPRGSNRPVFEVMWPDEIEAIRKRSKANDRGPWVDDFEAMALKTPIRRMLNRGKVRLTPQVANVIAEEEARELGYARAEILDAKAIPIPDIAGTLAEAETVAAQDAAAAGEQPGGIASPTPPGEAKPDEPKAETKQEQPPTAGAGSDEPPHPAEPGQADLLR